MTVCISVGASRAARISERETPFPVETNKFAISGSVKGGKFVIEF
jgi:hypothetical protein